MRGHRFVAGFSAIFLGYLASSELSFAQTAASRIDEALQNITAIIRPGRIGYATFWDGNKYVQCKRTEKRELRCEAAGASLQPSLQRVLTPERVAKLASLGWVIDPAFGNYAQIFPAEMSTTLVAQKISASLAEGYDADVSKLDIQTSWVIDLPCPPRNGRAQNLAGIVSDEPAMRATALRGCAFTPDIQATHTANSPAELLAIYGTMVTAEIQRLRINMGRKVFVVFETGIGYIQCAPEQPERAIYCEAQSAESWQALSTVLTPERVSYIRSAGYADPGRAPNYSKSYPTDTIKDAEIASEILNILFEAYGYRGATKLKTIAN